MVVSVARTIFLAGACHAIGAAASAQAERQSAPAAVHPDAAVRLATSVAPGAVRGTETSSRTSPPAVSAGRTQQPRNLVIILSDDHRYDFMGFMETAPQFLETPNLDRMAAGGAHVRNAFVTTSLCSPSRASILTGQYAHRHGVVDNTSPIPPGTVFFPQLLQQSGWHTAYIGKWHMGESDDAPQPGFDHWVSFRGQGVYENPTLNIDGRQEQFQGYTTDVLTDHAVAWLERQTRAGDAPFFLMLSHKAVHAEFVPAERHAGRYRDEPIAYPATMANTESNYRNKPRWVEAQRDSWHGVDFPYHGALDFDAFYRRYAETLLALDEGVGRVLDYLESSGLARNTLVLYMGDNGFALGEHGLIDKRHAYEESMRIPMLAWSPGFIAPGSTITPVVRNIDIAPTILELAGVEPTRPVDGRSILAELRGGAGGAPPELLYEYYWEYAFPHTPTTFALRGERFKYITYHGVWDIHELYDLHTDPQERFNLIFTPAFADTASAMRDRLWDMLERTDGMRVPVRRGDFQAAERRRR
jgi:N-acetylglucosamine-6-sulfatase